MIFDKLKFLSNKYCCRVTNVKYPGNQFFLHRKKILELNSSQLQSSPSNTIGLFLKILADRSQMWTTRNHRTTRRGPDVSLVMESQPEPKALTRSSVQNDWPWQCHHLMSKAVWTSEERGSHQLPLTNIFIWQRQANHLRSPDTSWFMSDDTDREISVHRDTWPPQIYSRADVHIRLLATQPPPLLAYINARWLSILNTSKWWWCLWFQSSPSALSVTQGKAT